MDNKKCKVCGNKAMLWEDECCDCYSTRLNRPSVMSKLWDFVLESISPVLTFASIFGMNFIYMQHMGYSSTEQILQGFALGWVASKFIRTY